VIEGGDIVLTAGAGNIGNVALNLPQQLSGTTQ